MSPIDVSPVGLLRKRIEEIETELHSLKAIWAPLLNTPPKDRKDAMTYGEGSPHFWRHQVQDARSRVLSEFPVLDRELRQAFEDFSVAHLVYCIVDDEYRSACEATGQPWPEDFLERFPPVQGEMERLAATFVRMTETRRAELSDPSLRG